MLRVYDPLLIDTSWAGVEFAALGHRDGQMMGGPGLFGFVCREPDGGCLLLYVDHADWIGHSAVPRHPRWSDALVLGMNELHVCPKAQRRIDRLQLVDRIVRRVEPLLNVLEQEHDGRTKGDSEVRGGPLRRLA